METDRDNECLLRTRPSRSLLLHGLLCLGVLWATSLSTVLAQTTTPAPRTGTALEQLRAIVGEDPAAKPSEILSDPALPEAIHTLPLDLLESPAPAVQGTKSPTRLEDLGRLIDTLDTLTRAAPPAPEPIQPVTHTVSPGPAIPDGVPSQPSANTVAVSPAIEPLRVAKENTPDKAPHDHQGDSSSEPLYRIGFRDIVTFLVGVALILGFFLTLLFVLGRRFGLTINLLMPPSPPHAHPVDKGMAQPNLAPVLVEREAETFTIQGIPEPEALG